MRDTPNVLPPQRDYLIVLEQATKTAPDTEDLKPAMQGRKHRGTDYRVETRRVPTAGADGYPHDLFQY
jgi:hypothetical protein